MLEEVAQEKVILVSNGVDGADGPLPRMSEHSQCSLHEVLSERQCQQQMHRHD